MTEERKKGRRPDFAGNGVAVWKNVDRNGNAYLTVQLLGRNGVRVNCFPTQERTGKGAGARIVNGELRFNDEE